MDYLGYITSCGSRHSSRGFLIANNAESNAGRELYFGGNLCYARGDQEDQGAVPSARP